MYCVRYNKNGAVPFFQKISFSGIYLLDAVASNKYLFLFKMSAQEVGVVFI